MKKTISCLRCNTKMNYFANESLQLGETSFLLGTLPNLLSGALEVDIYVCPHCGKIEFFTTQEEAGKDEIAKVKCEKCGMHYDMDYPKCPFCKN